MVGTRRSARMASKEAGAGVMVEETKDIEDDAIAESNDDRSHVDENRSSALDEGWKDDGHYVPAPRTVINVRIFNKKIKQWNIFTVLLDTETSRKLGTESAVRRAGPTFTCAIFARICLSMTEI